ncbi:MAG: DEAD/DEAH box helicase [Calditrichae bacterium]|nr:DEAD/DEAH box helicase [Calditrichia bacterium]
MNLPQLIDYLGSNSDFQKNITTWKIIPAQEAIFTSFPSSVPEKIKKVFIDRGISQLYTHQATAFEEITAGNNVVIVTPTASGKTLTYNLPILSEITRNREIRSLYLFPTKALAQDQVQELHDLAEKSGEKIICHTFDGDTPPDVRRTIRSAGHIVVTNPDMLHQGILPHHTLWIKLFENLRYIVIDEIHAYRGVFGSHLANVIRRLKRICKFYGSNPQFICCSATIANPREITEKIIGENVTVIDNNGAPTGEKHFIFYNPPVVNKELGLRNSVVKEIRRIVRHFLPTGIQLIVFARSRLNVEILVTYLKQTARQLKISPAKVRGYRGGYLPKERRAIEQGLRNGSIQVVVSTNALELGIDIGQLDVSIMAGYPGSIASTWQQAGRAGRRQTTSVSILVTSSSPLDQYIAEHPEYFFDKNPETANIDQDNLPILMSHLKCAAFELPFTTDENFGTDATRQLLQYLRDERILRETDGKFYWMQEVYPADEVSLRNANPNNIVIVNTSGNNQIIGEVDLFSAPMLVHKDAIYIHESQQFQVDELDWDGKKAFVSTTDSDYYTDAVAKTNLKVLDILEEKKQKYNKCYGEVAVTTVVTSFKKVKFFTHENVGMGRVYLPEMEMHSTSTWIEFPDELFADPYFEESILGEGIRGIGYMLQNLIPLYIMCDRSDISVVPMIRAPFSNKPTIYVYDKYPGGVGLSKKFFTIDRLLMENTLELISGCTCENGCPSCIGPPLEAGLFGKKSAKKILRLIL